MPNEPERKASTGEKGACLIISLKAVDSHIRASDGREIPFARAMLTIENACQTSVIGISPHATLGQEGGTVQDVTGSFAAAVAASLSPGRSISWDVYDLLLPAHPGTASKVHMFGYRAALNWRFELAVWAEYRVSGSDEPVQTPVSRWALRWSVADPAAGAVDVTIEKVTS